MICINNPLNIEAATNIPTWLWVLITIALVFATKRLLEGIMVRGKA